MNGKMPGLRSYNGGPLHRLGVFHHVTPTRHTPGMALDEDLFHAAVGAAERRIWSMLWDINPSRRSEVAEAAVRAARPFLDGTERARVEASDSGGTVTS